MPPYKLAVKIPYRTHLKSYVNYFWTLGKQTKSKYVKMRYLGDI